MKDRAGSYEEVGGVRTPKWGDQIGATYYFTRWSIILITTIPCLNCSAIIA